ncbi:MULTISPECIES: nitrite reductase small subunit NirD [unclassified Tatumella]|uniref:nitrite reductase small subunit NirD n=1 Tax=unclassified Tatumella TaxID=2649542 RepID=UPI001BB0CBDD|nr:MULTISPECIES: nitrite reductase small subunit NirD [unclassified Tatumella]MBS0855815.1 nitrite reductase small subunit NirD [Tatumella sp. JGM16]MBS0878275.1 nitrite reductase small subunit NirD [Tatumella sp. JGM82]MBS0891764.1 nitrite reductase small subunit NirD [Tatumella sp. JGM94]MBS0894762.1 nitrite reductase small subunit NirD [Tatumella sp. JGM130]MBS0902989.1 nitrite reductase small subunit NirD [Tatumella sp. JGM100]
MSCWTNICQLDDILPATGVCALLNDQQIALFRPSADPQVFAISNIDPFFGASVLSRGIIAEHERELWVASPLKKQHFRLRDGWCLEDENYSVAAYPVRVEQGVVQLQPCGTVAAGHGVLAG